MPKPNNARDNAAASTQANVRRPDAALSKPFSDGELLSYVGSLATDSPAMIIRGNLTLDTTNHKAYYASTHSATSLSRLEYSLLEALVKADGQFVNTSELVKLIGGPFFEQPRAYSRTPSTHWIRSSPAPASS